MNKSDSQFSSNVQYRRMLVVGNGFDIAHGLKTKYTDMLDSFDHMKSAFDNYANKNCTPVFSSWINETQLQSYVQNPFIKYFQSRRTLSGWTGFESELRKIVSIFKKLQSSPTPIVQSLFSSCFSEAITLLRNNSQADLWTYLKKYLDELIQFIDLYFSHCIITSVTADQISSKIPIFIYNQEYQYLLSFNYTNTYCSMLAQLKRPWLAQLKTHFIHGRHSTSCLGQGGVKCSIPQNIVLGFEDNDPEDLDSAYFKKYFQRIQKKTGRDFFDWIDPSVHDKPYIADIFGHSLDIADVEILKPLLENADHVNIFYLDQHDYEEKILNLIRIYRTPVEFTTRYYSSRIRFHSINDAMNAFIP